MPPTPLDDRTKLLELEAALQRQRVVHALRSVRRASPLALVAPLALGLTRLPAVRRAGWSSLAMLALRLVRGLLLRRR
jgi:hypothetical protein